MHEKVVGQAGIRLQLDRSTHLLLPSSQKAAESSCSDLLCSLSKQLCNDWSAGSDLCQAVMGRLCPYSNYLHSFSPSNSQDHLVWPISLCQKFAVFDMTVLGISRGSPLTELRSNGGKTELLFCHNCSHSGRNPFAPKLNYRLDANKVNPSEAPSTLGVAPCEYHCEYRY